MASSSTTERVMASANASTLGFVGVSLDRGANPNMEETVGRMTPLHMAALASGDLHEIQDIFKLLIHAGADLNKGDKIGETPLHKAARRGYTTVVIDP